MRYIFGKHRKNLRLAYFIAHLLRLCVPRFVYRIRRRLLLKNISGPRADRLRDRANYNCGLDKAFELDFGATPFRFDIIFGSSHNYQFDFGQYVRYWSRSLRVNFRFSDNSDHCPVPTFMKARQLQGDYRNSIIMNMDRVRHFEFVSDRIAYKNKLNKAVWRGPAYQPWRVALLEKWFGHQLCDIGRTDKNADGVKHRKPFMSVDEQLTYKFIISVEGNDVATNLKWIMSSNSLCFMSRPTKETWFMEGRLIANHHYVLLKDDFSDLVEKIEYYIAHESEALEIVGNAQAWVKSFQNQSDEEIVSLLVLEKYFRLSKQIKIV